MFEFFKKASRFCISAITLFALVFTLANNSNAQDNTLAYNNEKVSDQSEKTTTTETTSILTSEKKYFSSINLAAEDSAAPQSEFMKNLQVSGVVRFITYYRNMDKYYGDMIGGDKSIGFSDYPFAPGAVAQGAYPLLELNMTSTIAKKADFNVGYSFAHFYTGETSGDASKVATAIQNLRFSGNMYSKRGKLGLSMGTTIWAKLSRFTMGQADYRDDYFDRFPWDWYRNSFLRYDEYYGLGTNIGMPAYARSPFQGVALSGELYRPNVNFSLLYGRTNTSATQSVAINGYPSRTVAARVEKPIFIKWFNGAFGVNYYKRTANELTKGEQKLDQNYVVSTDMNATIKKIKVSYEIGYGKVNNPSSRGANEPIWGGGQGGTAMFGKIEMDKKSTTFPLSLEAYRIDYNFVSLDNSILNSNSSVHTGGYTTPTAGDPQHDYDNFLLMNVAQEVGQYANNRWGVILKGEKKIGRFVFQAGYALSQELVNKHDTITMQHRVNAFSRSRFRPWYQSGGNYGTLRSVWRRTYETFTINDKANGQSTDYKKAFAGVDLMAKYKCKLFNRDLVLMNFFNYTSVQDMDIISNPVPTFGTTALVASYYNDFLAAYNFAKKWTAIGDIGFEKMTGNNRVNMYDPALAASGSSGFTTDRVKGLTMLQKGYSLALGLSYDFAKNASIHLRNRWMYQNPDEGDVLVLKWLGYKKTESFVADQFVGTETTLEFKLFF